MKKLAIITTHPIQYYAPLFRLLSLSKNLDVKVFYTWGNVGEEKFDPGFGKKVSWDIPLFEGYNYVFVQNTSKKPGSSHFMGIKNPTLIHEIENWKADAILIFGWAYESHLKAMRHFKGKIPVFFRGDSTLLDEIPGYKTILRRILLSLVYRYIDVAFYVGTNNKNYFLRHGVSENNLIFAPHAVDNQRFEARNDEYDKQVLLWKQELGIEGHKKVIVFAGKFETKKNPMFLLQAFMELNIENCCLVFVGNGVLEEELKQKAAHTKNIFFIPFQNQSLMPSVYRLGDVFCLPSQGPGETWGLAINEAMASGKAVLVSKKCGCAVDLVVDDINGYTFAPANILDLKSKIEILLNKPSLDNMGGESLKMINNWDVQISAEAMEAAILYSNIKSK